MVVDLDDKSLADRRSAVGAKLAGEPSAAAAEVTVVGVGDPAPLLPIGPNTNLDAVIAHLIMQAHPELENTIQTCMSVVSSRSWKLVTCLLAGLLGIEDAPEAIYHKAIADDPEKARDALEAMGILGPLSRLIA